MSNHHKARNSEWLSSFQTADALAIHLNTLKRIPPSQLPFMRVGARGDRRYNIADIQNYIEEKMVRE